MRPLANITIFDIEDYTPMLLRQGYAVLDSQNVHIKLKRCHSDMFYRSSKIRGILPSIILFSSLMIQMYLNEYKKMICI